MSPGQAPAPRLVLPRNTDDLDLTVGRKKLRLTNLQKPFWPELHISKRDLLQYYIELAPVLEHEARSPLLLIA